MGWVEDRRAEQAAERNGRPAPDLSGIKANGPGSYSEPIDEQIEAELGDLAPPGCDNPYVLAGVAEQILELAATQPGGRNLALYIAAKALGRLADVDRVWLRAKLKTACEINGYTDDDGMIAVNRTIRSAFDDADDAGDRIVPTGPIVVEVGAINGSALSSSLTASASTIHDPRSTTTTSTSTSSALVEVFGRIVAAEQDFWERSSLRQIYDAALVQMIPPWALLAQCAGRALALIPPQVRLPGTIGGTRGGSLNWFAAVVGGPGMGKSSAADLAEELVPSRYDSHTLTDHPLQRNVGSGEGIVQAYVRRAARAARGNTPAQPAQMHTAILFSAEEIDTLTATGARQGSTLLPMLRQAFTGGTLGFAYAKSTNNQHLAKHTYRLVFILSGQPERYGPLLADSAGGTPQRFQWFPAFDLRIVDVEGPNLAPGPLPLPGGSDWTGNTMLDIPDSARALIRSTRVATSRGETGELGSHEVFARAKFASALGALDGRTAWAEDDWRRAGLAFDVSRITRDWVAGQIAGAQELEDLLAGRRRAVIFDAADVEKVRRQEQRRTSQIADLIRGKLAGGTTSQRDLLHMFSGRDRALALRVLEALQAAGQVKSAPGLRSNQIYWGFSKL